MLFPVFRSSSVVQDRIYGCEVSLPPAILCIAGLDQSPSSQYLCMCHPVVDSRVRLGHSLQALELLIQIRRHTAFVNPIQITASHH